MKLIGFLNRGLDVARVNGFSYLDALLNGFNSRRVADVGFCCESFGGRRIAFGDQVVHDDRVEISINFAQGQQEFHDPNPSPCTGAESLA